MSAFVLRQNRTHGEPCPRGCRRRPRPPPGAACAAPDPHAPATGCVLRRPAPDARGCRPWPCARPRRLAGPRRGSPRPVPHRRTSPPGLSESCIRSGAIAPTSLRIKPSLRRMVQLVERLIHPHLLQIGHVSPLQQYGGRLIDQPRLAHAYFRQHPFNVGLARQDREVELAFFHEPLHDGRILIHTEADGLHVGTALHGFKELLHPRQFPPAWAAPSGPKEHEGSLALEIGQCPGPARGPWLSLRPPRPSLVAPAEFFEESAG